MLLATEADVSSVLVQVLHEMITPYSLYEKHISFQVFTSILRPYTGTIQKYRAIVVSLLSVITFISRVTTLDFVSKRNKTDADI